MYSITLGPEQNGAYRYGQVQYRNSGAMRNGAGSGQSEIHRSIFLLDGTKWSKASTRGDAV